MRRSALSANDNHCCFERSFPNTRNHHGEVNHCGFPGSIGVWQDDFIDEDANSCNEEILWLSEPTPETPRHDILPNLQAPS